VIDSIMTRIMTTMLGLVLLLAACSSEPQDETVTFQPAQASGGTFTSYYVERGIPGNSSVKVLDLLPGCVPIDISTERFQVLEGERTFAYVLIACER